MQLHENPKHPPKFGWYQLFRPGIALDSEITPMYGRDMVLRTSRITKVNLGGLLDVKYHNWGVIT